MVRLLLSGRANPNCQNIRGETPLHLACAQAHKEKGKDVVLELLAAGSDPEVIDAKGHNPSACLPNEELLEWMSAWQPDEAALQARGRTKEDERKRKLENKKKQLQARRKRKEGDESGMFNAQETQEAYAEFQDRFLSLHHYEDEFDAAKRNQVLLRNDFTAALVACLSKDEQVQGPLLDQLAQVVAGKVSEVETLVEEKGLKHARGLQKDLLEEIKAKSEMEAVQLVVHSPNQSCIICFNACRLFVLLVCATAMLCDSASRMCYAGGKDSGMQHVGRHAEQDLDGRGAERGAERGAAHAAEHHRHQHGAVQSYLGGGAGRAAAQIRPPERGAED